MSRPVEFLEQQGGFCSREALVAATSRVEVDHAVTDGSVVVLGRGRYALPVLDDALAAAHGITGVLSHTSAALWHGWEVKTVPDRPHVTVPRGRKVARERASTVHLHHADLDKEEISQGICTSAEVTLLTCLRALEFDEGLAIVDSALRHGLDPAVLRRIRHTVRGPGRTKVLGVIEAADGDAANPFESVLRAIGLRVPGLAVRPQRTIVGRRQQVRPDLVDEDLRIVLEADSFEWHGGRAALARDARRYNLLVVDGWIVLRFAWEDVMFDQPYVRDVLVAAVDLAQQLTQPRRCTRCAA